MLGLPAYAENDTLYAGSPDVRIHLPQHGNCWVATGPATICPGKTLVNLRGPHQGRINIRANRVRGPYGSIVDKRVRMKNKCACTDPDDDLFICGRDEYHPRTI